MLIRCTSLENGDPGEGKSFFAEKCVLMQHCWGRLLQSSLEFLVQRTEIWRLSFCLMQTIDLYLNLSSYWPVWIYLFSTFFTLCEVKILLPTPHLSLPQMLAFSHTKPAETSKSSKQRNPSPSIFCLFSIQKLSKFLSKFNLLGIEKYLSRA